MEREWGGEPCNLGQLFHVMRSKSRNNDKHSLNMSDKKKLLRPSIQGIIQTVHFFLLSAVLKQLENIIF